MKNLLLQLAENVVHSLNVTSYYVCGGMTIGDRPDLSSKGSDQQFLSFKGLNYWTILFGQRGSRLHYSSREAYCSGQQLYNGTVGTVTWWSSNYTEKNPLLKFPKLQDAWDHPGYQRDWTAPPGLCWICRHRAYIQLPNRWTGSCVIGIIKPSFFLLSVKTGELLGYPVCSAREKRDLKIGDSTDDEWPPERIIEYYGPATWTEDGSWGYWTPIYMLSRIIWLQAVLEILMKQAKLCPSWPDQKLK
ncbi:Endogenous retrovirus group 3 member 1 Env polyprotein [Plecturocebus cupreus]